MMISTFKPELLPFASQIYQIQTLNKSSTVEVITEEIAREFIMTDVYQESSEKDEY